MELHTMGRRVLTAAAIATLAPALLVATAAPARAADPCQRAIDLANAAVRYEKAGAFKKAIDTSDAGLAQNAKCSNRLNRLMSDGFLLSHKAFSEARLGNGDWRTDFNQANALLEKCQTDPDLYGTHEGASCQTALEDNIDNKLYFEQHAYDRAPVRIAAKPKATPRKVPVKVVAVSDPVATAACADPDTPAQIVTRAPVETPALAQQQGISGDVTVVVQLDENSKLVTATVSKTPSAVLNNAALTAARQSTFKTRVVNCRPFADQIRFTVDFQ